MSILSKVSDYLFKKNLSDAWREEGGLPLTGYNRDKLKEPSKSDLINGIKSVIYSAININSNAFADVSWNIFSENSRGETTDEKHSPEAVLLRSVNSFMEGYTLNYLTNAWRDSAGVAYWWVKQNENTGIPEAIFPLSPSFVTPFLEKDGIDFKFYRYHTGSTHFDIDASEVIRFYNPSFDDPFTGCFSPLQSVWTEKNIWDAETKNALDLMKNNSRPEIIFSAKDFDGRMTKEQSKKLERTLKNSFSRAGMGGVSVVGVPLSKEVLSFSSRDAELIARKGATKIDILNALGVPVALFEGKDINRATLQTAMIQHGTYAIKPRIRSFKDTLNEKYLPMFGDKGFKIEFENPIPIDRTEEAKLEEQDLKNGVLTVNEVRAKRGFAPVQWGDEPFQFIKPEIKPGVKNVRQEKSQKQNDYSIKHAYQVFIEYRTGKADYAQLLRVAKKSGVSLKRINKWMTPVSEMKTPKICCSADVEKMKAFRKEQKIPSANPLEKVLRDFFSELEDAILKDLSKISKNFDGVMIKAFPDDGLIFLDNLTGKAVEDLADKARPQIELYYVDGVEKTALAIAVAGVEVDTSGAVGSSLMQKAIDRQVIKFSESTIATTSKSLEQAVSAVKKELLSGLIEEGDALPEMVKRVQGIFKNAKQHRARAIAVTESNKAFNNATLVSAEQSNVVKAVKWILSPDPCEICISIEGNQPEVAIGQKFTNTDKLFGDIEHPPAHVNCECTLGVVLIDF